MDWLGFYMEVIEITDEIPIGLDEFNKRIDDECFKFV